MRGDPDQVPPSDGDPPDGPRGSAPTLTTGPVFRTLLFFALPLLTTNILQSLSASVNAFWVSRALGPVALAATSNANLILFLTLGATFGFSMAANIFVAQAIGARDIPRAKRVIGSASIFFLVLASIVAVAGFLFTRQILQAVGTPPEALDLAVDYLRVIFVALPAMFLFAFTTMTLRGAGDARTPFWFMLLGVVLDAAFNPLFISGPGPFPAFGIAGAGLATLVSQSLALLGLFAYLYATRHFLRITRPEIGYLRPRAGLMRLLLGKGLPMGLQMMVFSASAVLMIGQVNRYGVSTSAAYGVVTQVWTYVQMPALAVSAAVSSMAGQSIGAGLWPRVSQTSRAGLVINLLLTGLTVATLYAVSGPVFAVFLADDPAALVTAIHVNSTVLWSFVLFGYVFVLFGVVRAAGAVWIPLGIFATSLLVIRPVFGVVLEPVLGSDAIWWSFPFGIACTTVMATLYYRLGDWRSSRMSEGAEAGPPPEHGLGHATVEHARVPTLARAQGGDLLAADREG